MTEKLSELKVGRRSFVVAGVVKLPKDGLKNAEQNERGNWLGVRTGFSVETSGGNLVYVSLTGGRMIDRGYLIKPPKQSGENMLQIPFADMNNPAILEQVADYAFKKANLETYKDADSKKFIDDIQYLEYLQEHLSDGMEVVVRGNVEYNEYESNGDKRVSRVLDVQNIYKNEWLEALDATGDKPAVPARWKTPHIAIINQTFLFDEDSLNSRFKKELQDNGKTIISAHVPQYVSKVKSPSGEYVKWGKVMAIPQTFTFTIKDGEDTERYAKQLEKLFKLKRGEVFEQDVKVYIKEGFVSDNDDLEISEEVQALIDNGLFELEDFQKRPVIKGTKQSELVYAQITLMDLGDGRQGLGSKDKYVEDILYKTRPNFETDEVSFVQNTKEVIEQPEIDINDLDALFG